MQIDSPAAPTFYPEAGYGGDDRLTPAIAIKKKGADIEPAPRLML